MLHKLFSAWQHGFFLTFIFAISAIIGLFYFAIPALVINGLLGLLGWGISEDVLITNLLWLFWLWVPLGLGVGARYVSLDQRKSREYPETERTRVI